MPKFIRYVTGVIGMPSTDNALTIHRLVEVVDGGASQSYTKCNLSNASSWRWWWCTRRASHELYPSRSVRTTLLIIVSIQMEWQVCNLNLWYEIRVYNLKNRGPSTDLRGHVVYQKFIFRLTMCILRFTMQLWRERVMDCVMNAKGHSQTL